MIGEGESAGVGEEKKAVSTNRRLFKSSFLIGGSHFVVILIRLIRSKALAILIGPSGVGLFGLYGSAIQLVGALWKLGIPSSGVRAIAAAQATGDQDRLARAVSALRLASAVLGVLGGLAVVVFSPFLSQLSFGDRDHASGMALLGLAVVFGGVSGGQTALLQGMRRIRDMAIAKILGASLGAAACIGIVWKFREQGVVPYLVIAAAMTLLISWSFARRIRVPKVRLSWSNYGSEIRSLIGLGLAFSVAGLSMKGSAYFARVLISHHLGIREVGLYGMAWTLSVVYVGFVFQAMAADFYPTLTAVSENDREANRLVNQQTEMGILLSASGILVMMSLSPYFIRALYSEQFLDGVVLLRWHLLGVVFRVVSWPLAFIQVAKGKKRFYIASELSFAVIYLLGLYLGMIGFGLTGIGMAYAAAYFFHIGINYGIARVLTGFAFSLGSVLAILFFGGGLAVVAFAVVLFPGPPGEAVGAAIAALFAVFSVRRLSHLLDVQPGALLNRIVRR